MARHHKRFGGGGGKGMGAMGSMSGFIMIVFGCVAMLVDLIMFGIAIQNLDTAYTSAASYTELTGLTSVMGIWGLVIFLIFMVMGIGALGAGAYVNIKGRMGGGWMDVLILGIMGGVTLVIALIMNGIIISQLHTAIGVANATTNYAHFTGIQSVMGIFGMIIFLSLMATGLAQLGGAGYGGYKKIRGGM